MRMLRWMCGVTKKDKIRNGHVRGSMAKKMTEKTQKAEVEWICEEGREARAKKNGRCTSTRKEMERNTEYQVERLA